MENIRVISKKTSCRYAIKRRSSYIISHDSGKGAVSEWDGNKDIGKGRMEIVESTPPSKVTMKLDMVEPFEAHNIIEFTLEPKGDATNVTWAMRGQSPYMAKIVHMFFNMDNMVGKDFETGLATLKAMAEK